MEYIIDILTLGNALARSEKVNELKSIFVSETAVKSEEKYVLQTEDLKDQNILLAVVAQMRVDIFNLKAENEDLKSRLSACQIKMGILDAPIETVSVEITLLSENSSQDADSESEEEAQI